MRVLPLNNYSGRSVRLEITTTFDDFDGNAVLMPPGEVIDVLWVCNRQKGIFDVRVNGRMYTASHANLGTCGRLMEKQTLEWCGFGSLQFCAG